MLIVHMFMFQNLYELKHLRQMDQQFKSLLKFTQYNSRYIICTLSTLSESSTFTFCVYSYIRTHKFLVYTRYSTSNSEMPYIKDLPNVNIGTYQDRRLLTDIDTNQMVTFLFTRLNLCLLFRRHE